MHLNRSAAINMKYIEIPVRASDEMQTLALDNSDITGMSNSESSNRIFAAKLYVYATLIHKVAILLLLCDCDDNHGEALRQDVVVTLCRMYVGSAAIFVNAQISLVYKLFIHEAPPPTPSVYSDPNGNFK